MKKFKVLLWIPAIIVIMNVSLANALSLNMWVYNEGYKLYDHLTGTPLTEDSLIEIIWVGQNEVIDQINIDNFTPGGDDEILKDTTGDLIGITSTGAGYADGAGEGSLEVFLIDIDVRPDMYNAFGELRIYIRFFNVADPVTYLTENGEVAYGETDILTVPDKTEWEWDITELNITPLSNFYTSNSVLIPEPASMILLFAGLIALCHSKLIRK